MAQVKMAQVIMAKWESK